MDYKKVERVNECNTLLEIIDNKEIYKEISENGLVILLNGPWGSGKTKFIDYLRGRIETDNKYEIFNIYNAYLYDYYDNAYLPFFASINDKVKLNKKYLSTIKNIGNESKKGILSSGYNVICKLVKDRYDIDLKDFKETIQELDQEEISKDILEHFNNVKKLKEKIKRQFNKYAKGKTQIFVIDELDRCKPSFALDTLEIVKHFFDLDNCIFIISVDKLQLESHIKSIYGESIDAEKYFSKLFDYQFNLLPISFKSIIKSSSSELYSLIDILEEMVDYLNISTRDSKKIFNELNVKIANCYTYEQKVFLSFLLILKYTDLSFYNELFYLNREEWLDRFKNISDYRLSKYNNVLNISVGTISLRNILEEVIYSMNTIYRNLESDHESKLIIFSNFEKIKLNVSNDVKLFVPYTNMNLSVSENIKLIVG